jgi:hypothetical protein
LPVDLLFSSIIFCNFQEMKEQRIPFTFNIIEYCIFILKIPYFPSIK